MKNCNGGLSYGHRYCKKKTDRSSSLHGELQAKSLRGIFQSNGKFSL